MNKWLDRKHGSLSFHLTQILSGHGCFNTYFHRIGKVASPLSSHCNLDLDSSEHTLFMCPAWVEQRQVLFGVVGRDLSLSIIVKKMIHKEEAWDTMKKFAEAVMSSKEETERVRQTADLDERAGSSPDSG